MQFLYTSAISAKNQGTGDTTLTNHKARLTQVRRKLVQLLQQVHCATLRKERITMGWEVGLKECQGAGRKLS